MHIPYVANFSLKALPKLGHGEGLCLAEEAEIRPRGFGDGRDLVVRGQARGGAPYRVCKQPKQTTPSVPYAREQDGRNHLRCGRKAPLPLLPLESTAPLRMATPAIKLPPDDLSSAVLRGLDLPKARDGVALRLAKQGNDRARRVLHNVPFIFAGQTGGAAPHRLCGSRGCRV